MELHLLSTAGIWPHLCKFRLCPVQLQKKNEERQKKKIQEKTLSWCQTGSQNDSPIQWVLFMYLKVTKRKTGIRRGGRNLVLYPPNFHFCLFCPLRAWFYSHLSCRKLTLTQTAQWTAMGGLMWVTQCAESGPSIASCLVQRSQARFGLQLQLFWTTPVNQLKWLPGNSPWIRGILRCRAI